MQRARVGLIVAILGMMAVWGCGQSSVERAAVAEREDKLTRLQEELHTLAKIRRSMDQDLAAAKADIQKLNKDIEEISRERDGLQQQLADRTAERDASIAQIDQFRSGLRALLSQMDNAAAPVKPVGVTASH